MSEYSNSFPLFKNEFLSNDHQTFSAGSYDITGFGSSAGGSTWNPLDPASNPGMNDVGPPNLMALSDGEPVKRTVALANFPDGSHNGALIPGVLTYLCGNRMNNSGNPSFGGVSHVVVTLGWVNSFSDKQWTMGMKNLNGIINMVAEKLPISDSVGSQLNANNPGGDIMDLIVEDMGTTDGKYIRDILFKKTRATNESITMNFSGQNPRNIKDLNMVVMKNAFSNKSSFFTEKGLLLWIEIVQNFENQTQLRDMLTLDECGNDIKTLYGEKFATMGYCEKFDGRPDGMGGTGRPKILNEWFLKGSSLGVPNSQIAFKSRSGKISSTGRYIPKINDNKFLFGQNNNDEHLKVLKSLGLETTDTDGVFQNTLTTYQDAKLRCVYEFLHIYSKSFNMPKDSAFNASITTAMPYLLNQQHQQLFKLHGVVEALDQNSESRSTAGRQFSSGPKAEIITRRRVQMKNLWGPHLKGGQVLYLVKTRNFGNEVESGTWYSNTIRGRVGYDPSGYDYFDMFSNTSASYDRPRSDFRDERELKNEKSNPFKSQKKTVQKYSEQVVYPNTSGSKICNVTRSEKEFIYNDPAKNRAPRYRYSKTAWESLGLVSKIIASIDQYGGFTTIPSAGMSIDELNECYGYPDILGAWNNPEIIPYATSIFDYDFPMYPEQSLFKTISGSSVTSTKGETEREWTFARLGNYELLNANGKLPPIEIMLGN